MAKKSPADVIAHKRQLWLERTAAALELPAEAVRPLLATGRQQSLRLNPLRAEPAQTLRQLTELGWQGQPVPWMEHGYTVTDGLLAVRDSQLVQSGAVFIQNAASWLPVLALDPQAGERVLDVCAAPGGKTTHIAAMAGGRARITANDNSRVRLAKLRANCDRMAVSDVEYTLFDARQLAHRLSDRQFDKILIDAPCSGEGMMQLGNDKDFATWSVAHIRRLQQLQRKIISQAWQLLAPGGRLVYSTCTMAPEEDEAVVDYCLRRLEAIRLVPMTLGVPNRYPAVTAWNDKPFNPAITGCLRLAPGELTEAFFVAVLEKSAA